MYETKRLGNGEDDMQMFCPVNFCPLIQEKRKTKSSNRNNDGRTSFSPCLGFGSFTSKNTLKSNKVADNSDIGAFGGHFF